MRRGTTPTLRFTTPYPAERVQRGFITFSQGGKTVLEKIVADDCVTVSDKMIVVALTQADTLLLTATEYVVAQLRLVLTGEVAVASNFVKIPVGDIGKDGEI